MEMSQVVCNLSASCCLLSLLYLTFRLMWLFDKLEKRVKDLESWVEDKCKGRGYEIL